MDRLLRKHRQIDEAPSFRVGIVQAQDVVNAKVRVVFPEYDEVISYWLFVLFAKTQNDKEYWMPDIGEQVVCLMDSRDEAGCVLGAVYSAADLTPVQSADKWHLQFRDGMFVEYDRAFHVLELEFQDSSNFIYDGIQHLLNLQFQDSSDFKYDATQHVLDLLFQDSSNFKYDAGQHVLELRFQHATDIKYDGAGHALYLSFNDGTNIKYDASAHLLDLDFTDSSDLKYDASAHLLDFRFLDGGEIKYDAGAHALSLAIPSGGTVNISANGASIAIDATGNVQIISAAQIKLGAGALKGVARLGDQVQCPAGIGTITSASLIVEAD
ncbi:MAG TPA: phage baseplate assembly protein V [Candidatus Binataceae bacterium]